MAAWVQWARRQLQLPSVPMESFNVDGATLASLTEEEFCQRAPQVSATSVRFTLVGARMLKSYLDDCKTFFFFLILLSSAAKILVDISFSILDEIFNLAQDRICSYEKFQ